MTQEMEQLDIFDFLNGNKQEEVTPITVQNSVLLIGQKVRIIDETKFPPFIKASRMGYRTGMTATIVSGFCGIIDILLDEEYWETSPRCVPASMGLMEKEFSGGAIEIIGEER